MIVRYCECDHTAQSHNREGCKRYDCPCEKFVEVEAVDRNIDRTTNYGH